MVHWRWTTYTNDPSLLLNIHGEKLPWNRIFHSHHFHIQHDTKIYNRCNLESLSIISLLSMCTHLYKSHTYMFTDNCCVHFMKTEHSLEHYRSFSDHHQKKRMSGEFKSAHNRLSHKYTMRDLIFLPPSSNITKIYSLSLLPQCCVHQQDKAA